MKITKDDAEFATALVIKDGAPLGLVQWVDTKTKRYCKIMYPSTSTEEGNYDRIVICPEEHPSEFVRKSPNLIAELAKEAGIEVLTKKEMDELRKQIGVRL